MATSSITKNFVIKDDAAFDVLIRVMQKEVPRREPVGYYEEGVRMLKKYWTRD